MIIIAISNQGAYWVPYEPSTDDSRWLFINGLYVLSYSSLQVWFVVYAEIMEIPEAYLEPS